jgi:hypothetical protein
VLLAGGHEAARLGRQRGARKFDARRRLLGKAAGPFAIAQRARQAQARFHHGVDDALGWDGLAGQRALEEALGFIGIAEAQEQAAGGGEVFADAGGRVGKVVGLLGGDELAQARQRKGCCKRRCRVPGKPRRTRLSTNKDKSVGRPAAGS